MWLIAGLGNPGPEYEKTRHNLGFMALDALSEKWKIPLHAAGRELHLGRGRRRGEEILLTKPLSYMNRSGEVLGPLARREGVEGDRILVLVDDLDLPLGTLRYRPSGGTAGHRGMESIVSHLGHEDFPRVRLGIGRPEGDEEGERDFVLSSFGDEEIPLVGDILRASLLLVEEIVFKGRTTAVTVRLGPSNSN